MNRKKLLKLRVDFYRRTRRQIDSILGKTSKTLKVYQRKYDQQIEKLTGRAVSFKTFFNSIQNAGYILVGDFHSEAQSSRSLLRICRELDKVKLVLALECIMTDQQNVLSSYLRGDIAESDFLKTTDWNTKWGFGFEAIRPLLHWTQDTQTPVFGINYPEHNLKKRDQKIARRLTEIKKLYPKHVVVVQIGDYHLAEKHLPYEMTQLSRKDAKRSSNIQVVYQSPESTYFKYLQFKKEVPDFIRFSNSRWAIMSVMPWVKWQNYLLQLEKNEQEVDLTDHVALITQHCADIVGSKINLAGLSVSSGQQIAKKTLMQKINRLPSELKKKITTDLQEGHSFYVPEIQEGVLGNYSLNHVARIAAQYILNEKKVISKSIINAKDNFLRLIWTEMVTYFLIKLINPKKKTSTFFDIRTYLSEENFDDQGREALTLALEQKLIEMTTLQGQKNQVRKEFKKRRRSEKSYYAAAEILGGILGEKVFSAFKAGFLKFPEGESFIFKNVETSLFEIQYYEALEIIESWPEQFNSKYELF